MIDLSVVVGLTDPARSTAPGLRIHQPVILDGRSPDLSLQPMDLPSNPLQLLVIAGIESGLALLLELANLTLDLRLVEAHDMMGDMSLDSENLAEDL